MKLKSLIKGDVLSIMASQLKRQKSHKLKNFELSDKIESQIKIYIHGIIKTKKMRPRLFPRFTKEIIK